MRSTPGSAPAEPGGPQRLLPDWPAPAGVHGLVTLRGGGFSAGPWGLPDGAPGGWNLGRHCGDAPGDVARNRALLRGLLPAEPVWLDQVHGCAVHVAGEGTVSGAAPGTGPGADTRVVLEAGVADAGGLPAAEAGALPVAEAGALPVADAAVTSERGVVLAVLTADCLPVLLADEEGTAIGVAHAGWRGLAGGVLERTVDALTALAGPRRWMAWLGPAIGPACFEVGDEVREAFLAADAGAGAAFEPGAAQGKWQADLFRLARRRLAACGVTAVWGGGLCTVSEPARFWSYRRDRVTGRMASVIWLA